MTIKKILVLLAAPTIIRAIDVQDTIERFRAREFRESPVEKDTYMLCILDEIAGQSYSAHQVACYRQLVPGKFHEQDLWQKGCGLFALTNVLNLYTILNSPKDAQASQIKDFYNPEKLRDSLHMYLDALGHRLEASYTFQGFDAQDLAKLTEKLPQHHRLLSPEYISLVEDPETQPLLENPFSKNGNVLASLHEKLKSQNPFFHGILLATNQTTISFETDHIIGLLVVRSNNKLNCFVTDSYNIPSKFKSRLDSSINYRPKLRDFIQRHIINLEPVPCYQGL